MTELSSDVAVHSVSGEGPPLSYYRDGAVWENDIARRNRRSRTVAWLAAAVTTVIALVALGLLGLALPLKTYEPYMIVVDRSTGFVEVKRPMAEGPLQQDEAVATFDLVRYLKARETYDPPALKDNFDLAQILSTGGAARDLYELYAPTNPQNPVKIFGRDTSVSVTIKSVSFGSLHTALVRFSTDEKSQSGTITHHWVSLVRFRYTNAPQRNEYRFQNPLGFQVTEYRRDQESVAPVGAAAQVGAAP